MITVTRKTTRGVAYELLHLYKQLELVSIVMSGGMYSKRR